MVGLRTFLGFSHPCAACDFWAGPCGSLLLLASVLRLVSVLFELLVLRVLSCAFAGVSIRQIRQIRRSVCEEDPGSVFEEAPAAGFAGVWLRWTRGLHRPSRYLAPGLIEVSL